ncbi:A-kinase anchor protein 1, mitochondrial-like isoform X2 [Xenia sp. Carnegie-2017]|nr:A-kinase anchor protein 1, mitochondrial-like isoform X2 [Xenia sp. Carnegie-2017]
MRISVKFLIGLAMPGLALAAICLLFTRKSRDNDGNPLVEVDTRKTLDQCCDNTESGQSEEHKPEKMAVSFNDLTAKEDGQYIKNNANDEISKIGDAGCGNAEETSEHRCKEIENPVKHSPVTCSGNNRWNLDVSVEENCSNLELQGANSCDQSKSASMNVVHNTSIEVGSSNQTSTKDSLQGDHPKRKVHYRAQSLDDSSDISSSDSQVEISDIPCHDDASTEEVTWELEFPQALCGRLIGKKGKNVQKISEATGTKIRLIPQKENMESSQRLVALTGSVKRLELALKALRVKFPCVPFTRLDGNYPYVEALPSVTRITLPKDKLFQVFVTNIVNADHFYVQLCEHSVQNFLRQLEQQMYHYYCNFNTVHVLQRDVTVGVLCAAMSPSGWWWRAQVVGLLMSPDDVEITWLDYGGRVTVPTSMLRELRPEFLLQPFQAVECYLSNVEPNHGENQFSMAACALLEQLTLNVALTTRITGFKRDCPNLELWFSDQWTGQTLFVNREFVRRGYARWVET